MDLPTHRSSSWGGKARTVSNTKSCQVPADDLWVRGDHTELDQGSGETVRNSGEQQKKKAGIAGSARSQRPGRLRAPLPGGCNKNYIGHALRTPSVSRRTD